MFVKERMSNSIIYLGYLLQLVQRLFFLLEDIIAVILCSLHMSAFYSSNAVNDLVLVMNF
jgi:hypothetical protein